MECGVRNISQIDDGISDAATVALALAIRCNTEYDAATEAASKSLDNNAQRRMLRTLRATREERIQAFLPLVMQYRKAEKVK